MQRPSSPLRRGIPKDARSPRAKHRKALGRVSVTSIEAKIKREWHEAQLAELRHQKLLGSLVHVEDVKRESFACVRAERDGFLSLPDRLAPVVAAEGDAARFFTDTKLSSADHRRLNPGLVGGVLHRGMRLPQPAPAHGRG